MQYLLVDAQGEPIDGRLLEHDEAEREARAAWAKGAEVYTAPAPYQAGDRVRFTADSLGLVSLDGPTDRFVPETVGTGQLGTVLGPHRSVEGWLTVRPDDYPRTYAPVHTEHIEPMASGACPHCGLASVTGRGAGVCPSCGGRVQ